MEWITNIWNWAKENWILAIVIVIGLIVFILIIWSFIKALLGKKDS